METTTMTNLELQSFDPNDSAEITREDLKEAAALVRQAARKNLKKTRMAFSAHEDSGAIRLTKRRKK